MLENLSTDTGSGKFAPTTTRELISQFEDYFRTRSLDQSLETFQKFRACLVKPIEDSLSISLEEAGEFYESNLNNIFQYHRHIHIPADHNLILITDLEADFYFLSQILIKAKFLERIMEGEKLALCFLGDLINRGGSSFKVLEFIAWLTTQDLFEDKVFYASGNHEVMPYKRTSLGTEGLLYSTVFDRDVFLWEDESSFHGIASRKGVINASLKRLNSDLAILYRGSDIRFKGNGHNWSVWREIKHKLEERYGLQGQEVAESLEGQGKYKVQLAARYALYIYISEIFDLLPLNINAGQKVFLSHTGITNVDLLKRFNEINGVSRVKQSPWLSLAVEWKRGSEGELNLNDFGNSSLYTSNQIVKDLLFADIYDKPSYIENFLRGLGDSRSKNYIYGKDYIDELMDYLGVNFSISGHQNYPLTVDEDGSLVIASFDSKIAAVAIRNANDGISLTNVVDDSLDEIGSVLTRMAELAEQSSNGIYTNTQRSALSLEFEALGSEISRISKVTEFNSISLLSNSSNITFQVGLDGTSNSRITLNAVLGTLSSVNLSSSGSDALTFSLLGTTTDAAQSASQLALTAVNAAITSISSRRGTIGAGQSRLESAINTLSSQRENFLAAESNIRDVDVAQEVAQMVRLQVLQQASTAVLAQANQQPAVAFGLLS